MSDLKSNKHRNRFLKKDFQKYGISSFIFSILETVPKNSSYEFLWGREKFYVDKHDSLDNGYNISPNFENPVVFKRECTEETREKLRKAMLGKPRPESLKKKLGRPVLQLDFNDNIIKEYYSLQDASKSLGVWRQNIRHVCVGNTHSCGGFKWQYKDVYERLNNK